MKKVKFDSFIVAKSVNLGLCKVSLMQGREVEISQEAGLIKYDGVETPAAKDIVILLRNMQESSSPWLIPNTAHNKKSVKPVVIQTYADKIKPLPIVQSVQDANPVIPLPVVKKRDLNRPAPIVRTKPTEVVERTGTPLPIKQTKKLSDLNRPRPRG